MTTDKPRIASRLIGTVLIAAAAGATLRGTMAFAMAYMDEAYRTPFALAVILGEGVFALLAPAADGIVARVQRVVAETAFALQLAPGRFSLASLPAAVAAHLSAGPTHAALIGLSGLAFLAACALLMRRLTP